MSEKITIPERVEVHCTKCHYVFPVLIGAYRNREVQLLNRVSVLEARNAELVGALKALKRHCFNHGGGDNSCTCDEIDAALQHADAEADKSK